MTLIQTSAEEKITPMDILGKPQTKDDSGKSLRPVRNRRYTRRSLVAGQRPQKRLFTPEIKRYLKDWLVRRRDNPYPNREEKKHLAHETGLTYIQICNWFANWRRKLKNVNEDRNQQTWGHLIRTYNDRAQGNVEQFSICSDDSIWSESEHTSPHDSLDIDPGYTDSPEAPAEYQREDSDASSGSKEKYEGLNNNTYTVDHQTETREENKNITSPLLLSKWLESAARFQPSETNYSWWADGKRRKPEKTEIKAHRIALNTARHDRDEVEAAVALTTLASATSRITAL
ncbi:homeobox protein Mohawk isoform X1 [Ostrinia furnacalis]|uniref:homeobox protein Mohawk isoform X1 n=1 Tax=Ostrinia furnacalis TaxID=93504 RepID=UPI00103E5FDA|nr:homeobox protein Mohawk isoform X1 [Ostrinia furnacalis]XP_028162596.1 homeobox protein Mohawk isoform X1 [Ostrinia furnacalis]